MPISAYVKPGGIRREHRTAHLVGLGLVADYLEEGRAFPAGAPTPAHDQTCCGLSIFLGKVRPSRHPAEDHPQVLIIAVAQRELVQRASGVWCSSSLLV
jgi:hypothetical protein